jgi:hypothetical protein
MRIRGQAGRVAISNHRLISADKTGVTFTWKDYRIEGPDRYKTMRLPTGEFIRRLLTHVLPKGLHRIRHYGLFANGNRAANIARAVSCSPCRPGRNSPRRPQPQLPANSTCCRVHVARRPHELQFEPSPPINAARAEHLPPP